MILIEQISANFASKLCKQITASLPEYFGLEEANENYFAGVKNCFNFTAKLKSNHLGLIAINFPYANNANIYWLGVSKNHHGQGIGKKLIEVAADFALEKNAQTMTVETLATVESDQNYLKTYNFYQAVGFKPLFDLKPENYQWHMVYMVKLLKC